MENMVCNSVIEGYHVEDSGKALAKGSCQGRNKYYQQWQFIGANDADRSASFFLHDK